MALALGTLEGGLEEGFFSEALERTGVGALVAGLCFLMTLVSLKDFETAICFCLRLRVVFEEAAGCGTLLGSL